MTKYEIIPTTVEHVKELSQTMRAEDQAEIWAAGHFHPWEALINSIRTTDETYTGLADGKVVAIFGVGRQTLTSDVGHPWMLSSDLVETNLRAWVRGCRVVMIHMTEASGVDHLVNHVDARYTTAVRWLAWMGFTIHLAEPYGLDKLPFHAFTWDR